MTSKLEIFVSGVTGYIGGAVLQKFLEHPEYNLTALVRSADKAEKLKAFGVTPVIGSLSDVDIIEKYASQSDVVVAMADCDDIPSCEAILRGLKKRHEATGKQPIFINTSGTGVLVFRDEGNKASDVVYDDMNPDQIETLAETQPHRPVDLRIVAADKEGYVKTYIILPSTIYSIAKGKLFDAGVANRHSQQVPGLIKVSLARKNGSMVGKGVNIWPHVDIDEVADLYTVVLNYALTNPSTGHGREGFYFGANGEYTYYELAKEISKALVELKRGESEEPTSLTSEEVAKYKVAAFGTTSRCVANRSFSIGWKPKKTTKDFYASVRPEVEALIEAGN